MIWVISARRQSSGGPAISSGVGLGPKAHTVPDHGGVEFQLVAEVIIDRGLVHAGPVGDFLQRGGMQAALGEDLARGVNQFRRVSCEAALSFTFAIVCLGQSLVISIHRPAPIFQPEI